jgi:Flp pilus assembly pilin Flp
MLEALRALGGWLNGGKEHGQDLVEYALLGGLIALALGVAAIAFSGAIADMAEGIGRCIDFRPSTPCPE